MNIKLWCHIKPWCQKVLELLDLSFAELFGLTWNIWEILIISLVCALWMDFFSAFLKLSTFLLNEGGNKWIIGETVDFMEYARYFQRIYPSQANSHKG